MAFMLSLAAIVGVRAQETQGKTQTPEEIIRAYLEKSVGLKEPLLSCVSRADVTMQPGHQPFDRFSATKDAYTAAKVEKWKKAFSEVDKQKVDSVVSLEGTARMPENGTLVWHDVTVRCGMKGGKLAAFEVVDRGAVKNVK
jgi:hypothetical protein